MATTIRYVSIYTLAWEEGRTNGQGDHCQHVVVAVVLYWLILKSTTFADCSCLVKMFRKSQIVSRFTPYTVFRNDTIARRNARQYLSCDELEEIIVTY